MNEFPPMHGCISETVQDPHIISVKH